MSSIHVTMFGPRRVGKTSLLASMYHRIDKEIIETDLRLNADPLSGAHLQRSLNELIEFPERVGQQGAGVTQDDKPRTYQFHLRQKESGDPLTLVFRDYPGGYISDPDNIEEVQEWLRGSVAIVVAIDTPALITSEDPKWGFLHQKHNDPVALHNFLYDEVQRHDGSEQLPTPRLMLFVPLKCEWCVQDDGLRDQLAPRVLGGYKQTFELLRSDFYRKGVVAVIAPVQTVGSLLFDGLGRRHGQPGDPTTRDYEFVFRKRSPNADWEPQDVEQPLRYLLQFILVQHLGFASQVKALESQFEKDPETYQDVWRVVTQAWKTGAAYLTETGNKALRAMKAPDDIIESWNETGAFWAGHTHFYEAASQFADGVKESSPFSIVQNAALLKHGTALKSRDD